MERLTKIEGTFLVTGRGLVVVPGPLRSEVAGGADIPVELRLPDGAVLNARASLQHYHQSPAPPPHIARQWGFILSGVTKERVPIGTEVWRRDAA
ncbi:MAG: hypothetical protein AMXMBFR59_42470 [Rhodanobacteraceae bacterium]